MKKNIYNTVIPRKHRALLAEGGALVFAFLLALSGCSKPMAPEHSNPADSLNPDFVAPGASIVYPGEGATLTGTVDTVRWTRVGSAQEFSWQIDNMGWHAWSADTFATISNASEGSHTVMVLARDGGEGSFFDTAKVAVRHYIKNRYYNAIMFYTPFQTVVAGDTAEFWCELEDMTTPVAGLKIRFYCNPYQLDTMATSADTGYHWKINGGTPVGPFISNAGVYYYYDVNIGVAGGTPAGVAGSGRILKLKLIANSSDNVYISSVEARDTLNNIITGITFPNYCYVSVVPGKEGGK